MTSDELNLLLIKELEALKEMWRDVFEKMKTEG